MNLDLVLIALFAFIWRLFKVFEGYNSRAVVIEVEIR